MSASIAARVYHRVLQYRDRVREEIHRSLTETHSPREVAGSFAVGTFITMLPTLGVGLLVFVVLSAIFASINKIALFASVIVFNPVVKWGVYAASLGLGFLLLGPVEGLVTVEASLDAAPPVVVRLLLGNLILAWAVAIVAYVVAFRIALEYRRTHLGEVIDEAIGELSDEVIDI